jgi:hypothetical protein
MHQRGTLGLMWGARGSFAPAAAMVVMVLAVGSWLLGHVSTVGIVFVFYDINLFFRINIYASIKSRVFACPARAEFFYSICKYTALIIGLFRHNPFFAGIF